MSFSYILIVWNFVAVTVLIVTERHRDTTDGDRTVETIERKRWQMGRKATRMLANSHELSIKVIRKCA